ncbi:MAG TPA: thiamine phosphate synthase [Solirubrobacteraceae bacterium]|nr:thiamine phosphate synthase [Solirubrobacteraceae bacterium]
MVSAQQTERRDRLERSRLYLVCAAGADGVRREGVELPDLIRSAVTGGVDIVQLREKRLADDELTAVASASAALCSRLGALLIVNDRPAVAAASGADGIHVGQDDLPVQDVREIVGPDVLVGVSTHTPAEIDAVDPAVVDYIGVGPVHETPTKPGRPAVGLGLVRYAAANATVPFFAIGGLDRDNLAEVLGAGATRVCVLRAITDAAEPEQAARELCGILDRTPAAEVDS